MSDPEMTDFADVGNFHARFGLPRVEPRCRYCGVRHGEQPAPRPWDSDLLRFRYKFLLEELSEFAKGRREHDHVQMADALIDLVYVAMGTAHFLGYPWEELWDDVQRANMKKERAADDGSNSKRGSGFDVIKPEGWEPPHTAEILAKHGWIDDGPVPGSH